MHFLLALSLLLAQYVHRSNPGVAGAVAPALTAAGGTTTCPGAGCVSVSTAGASTLLVKISGTWSGTVSFRCTQDNWVSTMNMTAFPLTNGLMGAGVTTTTANGTWVVQTNSYPTCGVYSDAFTSNTSQAVILDADPDDEMIAVGGVPGAAPVSTQPAQSSTAGTGVACNSGASPCTITNAAQNVLSANTSRKACQICAFDVVDIYCRRNTAAGSAASVTNADFSLNAGSAAKKVGGCWSCDTAGGVWQGALNCIGSAASVVVNTLVSETN